MAEDPTPQELLDNHKQTGEPLSEEECQSIVDAGLTDWDAWEDRGGGMYWLWETFPAEDE